MTLHYEPACAQDADAIFCLSRDLIDRYEDVSLIDYERVLDWVRRKIATNIAEYTCVFREDQKVGFYRLDTSGELAELDDFYILPRFRGQGIGTNVLRHCIGSTGNGIFLYVFKENTGAISLYECMGFTVSKDVGPTRCIMVRNG